MIDLYLFVWTIQDPRPSSIRLKCATTIYATDFLSITICVSVFLLIDWLYSSVHKAPGNEDVSWL